MIVMKKDGCTCEGEGCGSGEHGCSPVGGDVGRQGSGGRGPPREEGRTSSVDRSGVMTERGGGIGTTCVCGGSENG